MAKTYQDSSKHRNKLSKAYRFKKKIGRVKKPTDNNGLSRELAKKPKIIIRNLSFKTTEAELRNLYRSFGEIEEVKLLKRPDGKLVGCGFIQFRNLEDASKAIFKTNKSEFLGRTISTEWAIPKSQFSENLKREKPVPDEVNVEAEQINGPEEGDTFVENCGLEKVNQRIKKKKTEAFSNKNKNALSKAEQRKLYKLKKRQKRSRIVIRNLPFTITEEQLKEHFSKYGNIEEIKMLKKPNRKATGCCFLQFDRVQSAAQAIHHENLKTPFGRAMVVDWAIAKDKYVELNTGDSIKNENDEGHDVSIVKEEINDREVEIKEEEESDKDEIKQEESSEDNDEDHSGEDEEEEEEEEDKDDKRNIAKREVDSESVASASAPHPKRFSNDISEGKTVFIKNVPFTAKNEDLKQCMEQFGPVYYALICMDPLTEHSKGTAFVKFVNVEDAEKCLAAGTELKLHDQILDPHKALNRKEVTEKKEDKKKKMKDSRNLYLVKEGVILASSPAAQDVSASDMARRLQLEKWKSQMLRNLSMFVSRVRLVIHNLPPSMDDSKLRQLFKKYSNPNAVITEARVMRDLRKVDANLLGKSKEHGFVTFTKHEDALKALRSLNNNPNIFSKTKRPIVAFSIENRIMVNAKQRRVEKSRQSNPLYTDRKRTAEENEGTLKSASKDVDQGKRQLKRRKKSTNVEYKGRATSEQGVASFAGTTSKPGDTGTHGKFFLKKQATLHVENVKEQKKKAKSLKRLQSIKVEQAASRKEIKPKQGSKRMDADEVSFSRLVKSYKDKLTSVGAKSKWYET
ncbi:RNA-binding protein 28-like isoform X2 [Phymastichus coffea]|uniref:RNA-binding protein 28-like isoform X2 n=1 Tax=Phymastichus coffea TaxID=108790 RepID=UPI00273AB69F|nr:RNA-binding protein 28-like isoform X2 [Phymastichus coffea]